MILSRPEIKAAVERGEIRFDPPVEKTQFGDASVDLRLGFKFTKFKQTNMIVPLAKGIKEIADGGLWHEETFPLKDNFGKRKSYCLEPEEFILAQRLPAAGVADKELSVLLARDQLVPIVHNTTYEALREISPMLASRNGLETAEMPIADVAAKLAELVAT
jgi:deoxycytidine triphosphate deaminase